MAQAKSKYCTHCGEKNALNSNYCQSCGKKLLTKSTISEAGKVKKTRPKRIEPTGARIILARVICKTSSIVTVRPKLPTRHDYYVLKLIVVLDGDYNANSSLSDKQKREILDKLGTDVDIKDVVWASKGSFWLPMTDKGWYCCSENNSDWLYWPLNGSTIVKTKYVDLRANLKKADDEEELFYTKEEFQDEMNKQKTEEVIFVVVGIIILVIVIFWTLSQQGGK